MTAIRSVSVANPVDDPEVAHQAVRVLTLMEAMGLVELDEPVARLDLQHLRAASRTAARAGIGRQLPRLLVGRPSAEQVASAMRQLADALEESPLPASETSALAGIFGWPELSRVVGASQPSLRRYAGGKRATPDDVAYRIHWLARVVGYLRGAYNDAGIRRWFQRPRAQLDGKPPVALLRRGWSPDDARVEAVRVLAAGLSAAGGS
jgi:uncharacterized protein (DUF2384 family)